MGSEVPEKLRKLGENRALILLVECMGFLHDVGKLSENRQNHHKKYNNDVKENSVPISVEKIFKLKFESLLNNCIPQDVLENVKNCEIKGFQYHHAGKNYEGYWPQNWIEEIINLSDNKDSSEDRGKAIAEQKDYKSSVFGKEEKIPGNLEEKRKEFYIKLQKSIGKLHKLKKKHLSIEEWGDFHNGIIDSISLYFSIALAETRRAANDVTLFDHSYMSGTITKALIGKSLLNDDIRKKFANIGETAHFDDECDLDLLVISFNGLKFLSQSINLLDLRGRNNKLFEIKNRLKSLLEVEYPLGNYIYSDENNLCFLITPTNKSSFDYIKRKIFGIFNEETEGLLLPVIEKSSELKYYGNELIKLKEHAEKKAKNNFIENSSDFEPNWYKKWNKTVNRDKCVLCGKMPQWKGKKSDYLCEFCWSLRYKAIGKSKKEDSQWLDEIADENGKIAIVTGIFHPVDKWLSGEFLKYQKIKTREDLEEHQYAKKHFEDINDSEYKKIEKETPLKFLRIIKKKVNDKDFMIKGVNEDDVGLSKRESTFLGGKSKIGEFYWRLSEDNRKNLDKEKISSEEKDKIEKEIAEIATTKPPSPSRTHRIWRELQEFSNDVIKDNRKKIHSVKRLKFELENFKEDEGIYKADIPGIGLIEVFNQENCEFFTIERIDRNNLSDEERNSFWKNHGRHIKKGKNVVIFKEGEKIGKFKANFKNGDNNYKQFREISSSPNGFMFILPANKAVDVVKNIDEQFKEQFSKALGKLTLNMGIVFSHRKNPIYASLNAARRLRDEFKLKNEKFENGYISIEKQSIYDNAPIRNEKNPFGYPIIPITLNEKEIFWKIEHVQGNGAIDKYYPYLLSSDDETLHVTELAFKDKLNLYLNYFDFEYLDTTARRFDIVLGGNKKRVNSIFGIDGSRPYLLEDINKFERLRDLFEMVGSWTPIIDLESLIVAKKQEWEVTDEKNNVYKNIVKSALENKISGIFMNNVNWRNNIKPFLLNCILEGSFFDAIELYKNIMKIDLKVKE
jgi:CRISPR-associated Csx11 family protein